MRLNNYITESKISKDRVFLILQDLYTKCMPFINDLVKSGWNYTLNGDRLMYSGRNHNDISFIGGVRKNRQPLSTEKYEHNFLDRLFYKKFGWKARSNSIFCTGSKTVASSYGTVYGIFPIGKYKFIWNKDIRDLFMSFDYRKIKITLIDKHREELNALSKYPQDPEHMLYTKLDRKSKLWKEYELDVYTDVISKYTTKNLTKAIRSSNEIMVGCEKYYAVGEEVEKNIKMYISENKTKYPDEETFNFFWERWGNL